MGNRRLFSMRCFALLAGLAGCGLSTQGLDYESSDRATSMSASSSGASSSGASSSGSSSSGSSSSGSSGGSGGSGGSPPVVCSSGHECVAKVQSPGVYAIVAPSASELCPAGWTAAGKLSVAVDPGCTDCSCGEPVNGSCTPGLAHRWSTGQCGGASQSIAVTDGQCVDITTGASGYSMDPISVFQGMACVPTVNTMLPVPERALCTFDGGSPCDNGGVCVPIVAAPFDGRCQLFPVGSACPPGLDIKTTVYGSYSDMRSCSCSCDAPTGATCSNASIKVFPSNDCSGNAYPTVQAGAGCSDGSSWDSGSSFLVSAGKWTPGTCNATVVAKGMIAFQDAKVLCCAQ